MAIYPYKCSQCSRDWEEIRSQTSEGNPVCPECGGKGKRTWPKSSRLGITAGFKSGYDVFAGAYFDSDRQRNNYVAQKGLRKLYQKPRGDIVSKA